ncbi:DNA-methyltransferase [Lactobacillus mulieris]|uniref:DNA-methyltransferase n=1 Tax=Lactobacillus mulieris TaxID=2508708 RepID=UPI002243B736|nr:site-specific DNA-methyltransferase [Lactobacillus mulieris]MCW8123447.1 site-specific DNA-methyltransferase [Lactobacillus mulieris]MCZ3875817.1 site-specific DNA-methyltransferase [Lactobacillus mulieris]MDK7326610.1 site-specific DNA-methyltransferase [Lactobacillus mulieris]WEB30144.1 site-specific DNA-methyltransferase [Lactobacillus mulieris]
MQLINGDCLEKLGGVDTHSIDLVVTDPPYEIGTAGAGIYKQKDKSYIKSLTFMSNGFDKTVLDELVRVMKKINIYIFCSQKQIPLLINYFVKQRKCNWNLLTWHKTNPVPACGNKYLSDTEYIFFAREKGVKIYGSYQTKRTYYLTPSNVKEKKLYNHPTVKPQNILENLITNSSKTGDTVLDPFMGSGSTGVACLSKHRDFIGVEINEEYFKTAKERISNVLRA